MAPASGFTAVIGLEVHVQLLTETKMFCPCPNRFGAEPNTLVCPVCLGYPGALPVPNRHAVDLAIALALALDCTVHPTSRFARKSYFYPDLPKGYQITQTDRPLASEGRLPLTTSDKRVRIERLHLEEDAGKLLHEAPGGGELDGISLIDFNRAGVPLVEIVSQPDLGSAAEAQDYLQTLHHLLRYTGASEGSMEEGNLRCDANVSLRPAGSNALGTKTEIKNVNSFRNVARAIDSEIERQSAILESGGTIRQETRGFDPRSGTTRVLRHKEEAGDYRYSPEPDLLPLIHRAERLARLRGTLPELPWAVRSRFEAHYGLRPDEARLLAGSRELADYYEAAVAALPARPKEVANWVRTEVLREIHERGATVADALPPERLAALIALVDAGVLSRTAASRVLTAIWDSGEEPSTALARLDLGVIRDPVRLTAWIDEVLRQHAGAVEQFRAGKSATFGFLVGRVLQLSGGRAEPSAVQSLLRQALSSTAADGKPS